MNELEQLKKNYEILVAEYVYLFCKKYKIGFDFWVADDVATVASFDSYYFISFDNIKYDIDNDAKHFLCYYQYCEDNQYENCMNYGNYCKGFRDDK